MRRPLAPFKACRNCRRLVPTDSEKCPYCGSTDLSRDWTGMVLIISKDSEVAKKLNIEEEGRYALKIH
ncbi:DNA-binding protein [archaeon]|nr:MAG: DNA-binding protein [archaeon]